MSSDVPYTLTKAKKLGIRHARLPTKRTVGYVRLVSQNVTLLMYNEFQPVKLRLPQEKERQKYPYYTYCGTYLLQLLFDYKKLVTFVSD